jgi:Flp pilus assembly protein CpaB
VSTQQRVDIRGDGRSGPALPGGLSASRAGGDRLPRPPGTRRPGLAAIAVLLIVLGGAVAGLLAVRIDQRVPVLVARADIPVGTQIEAGDLAVARIAADGIATVPSKDAGQVIGHYATAPIGRGQLVTTGMLGSSGLLTAGKVAVGVSLAPGRFPASGLQSGDVVQVVNTATSVNNGNGKLISDAATVSSVHTPSSGTFGSSTGSNVVVTLVLDQSDSTQVATAAAANQVSLVLVRRG